MVTKQAPLILLYVCMTKNEKDNKQTIILLRRIKFVRNGEEYNTKNIVWCEGGLKLEEIVTKNVG